METETKIEIKKFLFYKKHHSYIDVYGRTINEIEIIKFNNEKQKFNNLHKIVYLFKDEIIDLVINVSLKKKHDNTNFVEITESEFEKYMNDIKQYNLEKDTSNN